MTKKYPDAPKPRKRDSKELFVAKILAKKLIPTRGEKWFALNHKERYALLDKTFLETLTHE